MLAIIFNSFSTIDLEAIIQLLLKIAISLKVALCVKTRLCQNQSQFSKLVGQLQHFSTVKFPKF